MTTHSKIVAPLKTGELLVKEGLIRLSDIDTVLDIQKGKTQRLSMNKIKLFGSILCSLNLITPQDNYYVLDKYSKVKSFQMVLIEKGLMTKDQVIKMDQAFRQEGTSFISHLMASGTIGLPDIQQMLFDLFHIPFRPEPDLDVQAQNREQLGQVLDETKAGQLGIIPLEIKERSILFGITEPDNIKSIRKFNEKYPQYRFHMVFIPYAVYQQYFDWIHHDAPLPEIPTAPVEPTMPKPIILEESEPPRPILSIDPVMPEESGAANHLDLTFLLKFKTEIQNPAAEKKAVKTLYERYEQLRKLSGHPKREDHFTLFNEFIIQSHDKIVQTYQRDNIEFSLKKEGAHVTIIALPR